MPEEHQNLQAFRKFFAEPLNELCARTNPPGMLITTTALALLERYLRAKSQSQEDKLKPAFYAALGSVFPSLSSQAVAKRFWNAHRNGLLHQAAFSARASGGGFMQLEEAVELADNGKTFWLDPVRFAKSVVQAIEDDIETFAVENCGSEPLPGIYLADLSSASDATQVFTRQSFPPSA